jgi:7-cyano-7-deazaguanine reductase
MLETFKNKHEGSIYLVEFKCPEFTSLCLTGDTLIDICCNEKEYPKGVPIQKLVGTNGYVFSFDIKIGKPVVKKYYNVRKTQNQTQIITVRMLSRHVNKGKNQFTETSIQLTPNHLVLVKIGFCDFKWVKACELMPGMRIISDQRSNDNIRNTARHKLIANALFPNMNGTVHHKDGNHYNNNTSNIEVMSLTKHNSHHQSLRYGYDKSIKDEVLINQYVSGFSVDQLCEIYNCDGSTIRTRLERNNIQLRSQSESMIMKRTDKFYQKRQECKELYEQGFTCYELSKYFNVDTTTISSWIKESGGKVRTSLESKQLRKNIQLQSLNHKVIEVQKTGYADVYNMEVEDTECYFANGIVVHNCPRTGQPDFATMYIRYIPRIDMVESKSLKLYLFSFRNHGDFHEDCTNIICKDLTQVMDPFWIRVVGDFVPRGGISIVTVAEHKRLYFDVPEHFKAMPANLHTRHM